MTTRSDDLLQRARRVLPGGVSSPVRAFGAVGGQPRFIERARGSRLWDESEASYVDYVQGWGAMILGHAHPDVVEAIERAARGGTSYGLCSRGEVELAELIVARVPSVERVRFTNSGTEATMTALRLARAATGRELIVKFAGNYHGHADPLLARIGSGGATFGLPDSPGVPAGATAGTLIAPYNDLDAFERCVAPHADGIAAVIVEPVAGNMGVVPPASGFLEHLRSWTRRVGAVLILDEVMTGFRVGPGGAQVRFGIEPDLTTFGKIIGGGLPIGALGGSSVLMDRLAPAGPVYSAGTFSGNPVATAAGAATLRRLDDDAYARLESTTDRLARGLAERLGGAGHVQRVGSMLTVFFGGGGCVAGFEDARAADHAAFARFFRSMLDRGVHLPPSGYEAWFVSLAHTAADIDATLDAAEATFRDEHAAALS